MKIRMLTTVVRSLPTLLGTVGVLLVAGTLATTPAHAPIPQTVIPFLDLK
jgi:hypothetical protein